MINTEKGKCIIAGDILTLSAELEMVVISLRETVTKMVGEKAADQLLETIMENAKKHQGMMSDGQSTVFEKNASAQDAINKFFEEFMSRGGQE
ncbi:hypothetical protein M2144_002965 [Lachnospiraceae bacterium PFB1-22]|uniref:Uncharacterized protein n=1 Tax=Aequitasia blattaphilus TaxID=2949332 RepID=A0ABT1ED29_9FIRM|nr:hypothetical protein [Aequitasia blattaphilus]MCP1103753.1 hypothetical protein [Aequitasia blattaphilus]MCR8616393.1 hypothetical protein [Aequitasia blattaphilus]